MTDLLSILIEQVGGSTDFSLAAAKVTLPVVCSYELALWLRAFLLKERSWKSIGIAVLLLPLWLVSSGISTLVFIPLGRIS